MSTETQKDPAAVLDQRPRLGPAQGFSFPRPRELTLPRGSRLVHLEKRDLPLVYLLVQLRAGSDHDPAGAPGVAYLTGRMLLEGAGERGAMELAEAIQAIGATLSSWADEDGLYVSLQVLRRHLDEGLDLLADVLLRPKLAEADFQRVRDVIRGRAEQRRDHPSRVAQIALRAAIFGQHPYGRPLLPRPKTLEQRTVAELRAFHRRWVRPERAVLLSAGDVGGEELTALLEQRLGSWGAEASGAAPAPAEEVRPPAEPPRLVLVHRPGASQSAIRVGLRAPARRTADYTELQLLNTVLGGSFTSRLNQNLRERHGFTYGVHSNVYHFREAGFFVVRTSVATEDTTAALGEIFKEMNQIRKKAPTRDELLKARRLLLAELPSQAETVGGLVDAYSEVLGGALPLSEVKRYAEELSRVPPAELLRVAREHLPPERATVVVVGDLDQIRAPLEAVYGKAEQRDLDGLPR